MNSKESIKSKIVAHLDGDISPEDLNELTSWISRSKENARYYTEIKDLWEASVIDAAKIAETEKEWKRFVARINTATPKVKLPKWTSLHTLQRFAAILIIGILFGGVATWFYYQGKVTYFTSIAPKGSISKMVLPDSTLIYLNAGSEIKYCIGSNVKQREVFLNGEAFFKVAKMKKQFVVHTNCYDVHVLGTQFNVRAYDSESKIETTLEEGSVLATSSKTFTMAENVALHPGEQLVFDKVQNKLFVKSVDTELFTSWKENKLIFIKMSFDELVKLLERKYGVDIEVEDNDILSYHYSGTIKNETILELLEVIKHTLPIRYEIDGQKIKILKNI